MLIDLVILFVALSILCLLIYIVFRDKSLFKICCGFSTFVYVISLLLTFILDL